MLINYMYYYLYFIIIFLYLISQKNTDKIGQKKIKNKYIKKINGYRTTIIIQFLNKLKKLFSKF